MLTDAGRKLLAVTESIAPFLDDEQAERAVRYLMALAGEGGPHAATDRRLEAGRVDRELGSGEAFAAIAAIDAEREAGR